MTIKSAPDFHENDPKSYREITENRLFVRNLFRILLKQYDYLLSISVRWWSIHPCLINVTTKTTTMTSFTNSPRSEAGQDRKTKTYHRCVAHTKERVILASSWLVEKNSMIFLIGWSVLCKVFLIKWKV